MKLSDFEITVHRDGEFITTGYVDSESEGTLTYCDNAIYLKRAIDNPCVSCVITTQALASKLDGKKGAAITDTPRIVFYRIHNQIYPHLKKIAPFEFGIGTNCDIHESAIVSKRSRIGNHVTIGENVVIKDHVDIGDHCFIDAGCIIGCEALLYYRNGREIVHVRHGGGVQIGARVTILGNAVIARSPHQSFLTAIGNNSIIGITSNVGHEAQIEQNCVVGSNCVIARRARICEGSWIGPNSVIREHVTINRDAQVKLGSIVIDDVGDKQVVSGNFAIKHITHLKRKLKS